MKRCSNRGWSQSNLTGAGKAIPSAVAKRVLCKKLVLLNHQRAMAIFGDVGNQNSGVSSKRPPGTVRAFFLGSEQNRLLHWTVNPAPQAYGVRVPGYPPDFPV